MKDRFMKNGVFSLEYDKETLRDIVLELQEENQKLKKIIKNLKDVDTDFWQDDLTEDDFDE